MSEFSALKRADGETVAYRQRQGASPGILWLGGFHSDMGGIKASALDDWAASRGRACTRFDYFGHGASSGEFRRGTVGRWLDDALAVLDELCSGPQILVGSSMGAWIALHVARLRPEKAAALLLIAPAPDFTERLIWARFTPELKRQIAEEGEVLRPSLYGEEPYPIARELIEEGRKHLVLGSPLPLRIPVHIVHGMADPDVPWQLALELMDRLPSNSVLTLVKEGDHRLSRPADLKRMEAVLDALLAGL